MKPILLSLTILFLLLAEGACAQIPAPLPSAQLPTPFTLPGQPILPPGQGNGDPTAAVIPGVAVCTCPTTTTPTPPSGTIQAPGIICSCPAILLPPTAQTTEGGLITVALEDNGKTFILQPGERILLNLGMEPFKWTVTVDDQDVLSRVPNILVIAGTQGVYEAHHPGLANLTAAGDPLCRSSKPMCMMPSMIFQITVIVQL